MFRPLLTAVGVFLTLLAPLVTPRAQACSPQFPGLTGRSVFPASGAVGVPLNTRILVRYTIPPDVAGRTASFPTLGSDIELRALRPTDPVPFTHEVVVARANDISVESVVVVRPAQPLMPSTVYQLLDRRANIPCNAQNGNDCALGAAAVFASFTTGAAADTTAPRFSGLQDITVGLVDRCQSSGCCGPYLARLFPSGWQPAQDDVGGPAVLYNLYHQGTAAAVAQFLTKDRVLLTFSCQGYSDPLALRVPQEGSYFVRAVDWAGNEDSNMVTRDLHAGCQELLQPDAGTDSAGRETGGSDGDASAPTDHALTNDGSPTLPDAELTRDAGAEAGAPASPRRGSGGGCAVAGPASDTQDGAWGLTGAAGLGLLLLLVARRRPGRPPASGRR